MNDPPGEMGSAALPLSTMPGGRPSEPGNGHIDQPAPAEHAALQSRIAELEIRLRERVEENIVLDHEVRCLQKERLVTQEYLASLQQDARRLPEVERDLWGTRHQLEDARSELEDVRSELDAFRNRLSRVLVDRIVVSAQRYPGTYRAARYLARRMANRFRS
ncbi:MAG: hypothetical protein ABSC41_11085 [Acidimicrobiales bacterium]|jgi:chromosome segregation ATPase